MDAIVFIVMKFRLVVTELTETGKILNIPSDILKAFIKVKDGTAAEVELAIWTFI